MDRQMLKQLAGWLDPYRVTDGSKFRLARIDPADTAGLKSESKQQAARRLAEQVAASIRAAVATVSVFTIAVFIVVFL